MVEEQKYKNVLIRTSALTGALLLALAIMPSEAGAQCLVTGTGSIAIPDNGDVVTCSGTTTSQIGNGTTDATVTLEDGALLDRSGVGQDAVSLNNATVTLGAGSVIDADGYGVVTTGSAIVTLGANAQLIGDYGGIYTTGAATVTLGAGALISGGYGIYSSGGGAVTLGEGARVEGSAGAITGLSNVTLASGAEVENTSWAALFTTAGNDVIDTSGLIKGAGFGSPISMGLRGGDDTLILRTGSDIVGEARGGTGVDTVFLYGTGSETEVFLAFENVIMNGDSWALSGTSIFNTIDINSGTFFNNGFMTSDVNVNANGILGGTGTLFGNVVNDGIVAPGSSIGMQTISGNYTQGVSGDLEIEFDSASADLLNILGAATLDGTVNFTEVTSGIANGNSYTFLGATAGITGAFSAVNDQLLFIDPVVTYTATTADVTLNRVAYTTTSTSSTENTVAAALDSVLASDPSSITSIEQILNSLSTPSDASNFFASQSGIVSGASISAGAQALNYNTSAALSRVNVTGSSLDAASLSAIAPAAGGDDNIKNLKKRSGKFWMEGTGGFGHIDSDSKGRGASYTVVGITAGADTDISEKSKIGVFGSYSLADSDIKTGLGDSAQTNVYQAGVYGAHDFDPVQINGSVSAALLDFNTNRPTASGTAIADFNGRALFGMAEASYKEEIGTTKLFPFLGLKTSILHHASYNETGAGALNLSVQEETTRQLSSEIGLAGKSEFKFKSFIMEPSLRLSWRHEFLDDHAKTRASFSTAPAVAFQSQGASRNRDSFGIKLDLIASQLENKDVTLYCSYDGDIAADAQDHIFTAGVRYLW